MPRKVRDPSMPLYIADWLSSQTIALMNAEQERGFLRLLMHAWLSGNCTIPDDDESLSQLSLMGPSWFGPRGEFVRRCFTKKRVGSETKLTNRKLADLWKERRSFAERGRKGGLSAADARRSEVQQTASKTPTKRQAKGKPTSSSASTSSSSRSIIDAALRRLRPEILFDTGLLLAFITELVEAGAIDGSEMTRRNVVALAFRSRKYGKNPTGLFVSMMREGKFDHLACADDDAASEAIREWDSAQRPPLDHDFSAGLEKCGSLPDERKTAATGGVR